MYNTSYTKHALHDKVEKVIFVDKSWLRAPNTLIFASDNMLI